MEVFPERRIHARRDACGTGADSSSTYGRVPLEPGLPVLEREREHILPVGFHGRWSYPLVFVMKDRVLIVYTYSVYEQHPTRAELILSSRKPGGFNQELKVLPLT